MSTIHIIIAFAITISIIVIVYENKLYRESNRVELLVDIVNQLGNTYNKLILNHLITIKWILDHFDLSEDEERKLTEQYNEIKEIAEKDEVIEI